MEEVPKNDKEMEVAENDKELEIAKSSFYFGFRDLTSDYYQVMIEKGRPGWCRVVWMVIILCLLFFTGYVVYLMVAGFLTFGSYDKIETITNITSITLPSVTICSLNTLNYTLMKERLKEQNSYEVIEDYMLLIEDAYWATYYEFKIDETDYLALGKYEKLNGPLTYRFKNTATDLLAGDKYDYKFGGLGQDITKWLEQIGLNELGECVELNDDASMKQVIAGPRYGLTIDLDAGLPHYSPLTASLGFRVFIKDHDETMFFNEGGYIVAPGTETFMKIILKKKTRLASPWGSCIDVLSQVSKFNYTKESRKECFQLSKAGAIFEHCDCVPWYVVDRLTKMGKTGVLDWIVGHNISSHVKRKKRDVGDTDDENDYNEYMDFFGEDFYDEEIMKEYDNYDDYFVKGLNYSKHFCSSTQQVYCDTWFPTIWKNKSAVYTSQCGQLCSYNEYEVAVTSSSYPASQAYFDNFTSSGDMSWEYAQKNLVRLHIFYSDIEYQAVQQTKNYQIQNFIGELGGVVDLFIGFSFFTVFQLMEIGVAGAIVMMCRKRKANEGKTGTGGSNNV